MAFLIDVAMLTLFINVFFKTVQSLPPYKHVDRSDGLCATFALPYGYACDEYMVQTVDGFLVGVQRLRNSSLKGTPKGTAFLNHGILVGGEIWLLNGPEESLGFIMADAGYDVWLGNIRSSFYSYGHMQYDKHDKGFWDWSLDELALYDFPAMLDVAYSVSGRKINYIGYSQGTQTAFAALSEKKVYDSIDKAVMLAPVAYIDHTTSLLSLVPKVRLDQLYYALQIYEFNVKTTERLFADYICELGRDPHCVSKLLTLLTGPNCCLNYTRKSYYERYEPQSTSTKNVMHLAQQYRYKTFGRFDHGAFGNMRIYGARNPPPYNLSQIPNTIPMLLFYSGKDSLANSKNVDRLQAELPIKPKSIYVEDYAHLDFVVATNAKDTIYPQLLTFLENSS